VISLLSLIFFQTSSHYVTQAGPELMINLLELPKHWYYRCAPPYPVSFPSFYKDLAWTCSVLPRTFIAKCIVFVKDPSQGYSTVHPQHTYTKIPNSPVRLLFGKSHSWKDVRLVFTPNHRQASWSPNLRTTFIKTTETSWKESLKGSWQLKLTHQCPQKRGHEMMTRDYDKETHQERTFWN
jgi:hypothetical protein